MPVAPKPKPKPQSDDMDDNIIDGLRDAGCSEELIELYGSAASNCARICLLKRHRRELLDDIHSGQQKLEHLDYLIYRLRSASTGYRINSTASRPQDGTK